MPCSRFPAGIVRPFFLLVLIGLILCTSGCTRAFTGTVSSAADPGSADAFVNNTSTPVMSDDFMKNFEASLVRPAGMPDRSIIRPTTVPVIRITTPPLYTGPTLIAKGGSEVNMSEVELATETIDPSGIRG